MNEPHGIIVFGANGSGKLTLGLELTRVLNFKYMDIEDYNFKILSFIKEGRSRYG